MLFSGIRTTHFRAELSGMVARDRTARPRGRSWTREAAGGGSARSARWRAPALRRGGERRRRLGGCARVLRLDGRDAFELSLWCGISLEAVQERLAEGVVDLDDDVIRAFAALLRRASYLP